MHTTITGSGSFIPPDIKKNNSFIGQRFYDTNRQPIPYNTGDIISKFQHITGIAERRYADANTNASCMAAAAASEAITDAGIDAESIDQLIVAHNFGDVLSNSIQSDAVPSIASRVKHRLGIRNPSCVAYDLLFGCPGWLQGLIQADAYTKAGLAGTCLVIGTEALSRVTDPYDRDSMIFSDGAGAVVTRAGNGDSGILSSRSSSYAGDDIDYICMGKSNYADGIGTTRYIKMQGRKVYEFALTYVPRAMKACLDDCGLHIDHVKKIFIHQANEKMDEAIVKHLFRLYSIPRVPPGIMPMNIQTLGNSSVATIPTLYNMVSKGLLKDHVLCKDDIILFASVGAGMNINAVCYRV
jgi:3-oxoacyl-[acyl-carrier-protein] synthase III